MHRYKARIIRYLQQFSSICDSLMPRYGTLFWKKDDFSWNISSWCMPQLERFLIIWKVFYSYVQGKKQFVSSTIFPYLRVFFFLVRYILFGKRWFSMKYFKLVHAPTWKIPSYITGYLSKCTRQEAFGIFNNFPLSTTLLCLVRYIFSEKDDFSWNISSWCMPQLERFLIICRFSIHMYKAWNIRYFQHFSTVCDSLMPSKVHLFEKDEFFMEYFKLVHAPTWKIP